MAAPSGTGQWLERSIASRTYFPLGSTVEIPCCVPSGYRGPVTNFTSVPSGFADHPSKTSVPSLFALKKMRPPTHAIGAACFLHGFVADTAGAVPGAVV